jgi:tetratricopeptide (TPR) repeat protein
MGSIVSSMATFRRCVKNFEQVPDVYNYYGELLLDQGKFEEAIAKFDKAMEMEKQTKPMAMNVLPLINKALALFQQKSEFSEAEKLCEKALIRKLTHPTPKQDLVVYRGMLTTLQWIRSATSLLLQWHSSCCNKARSPMPSDTLSAQLSWPELPARSSTHSPTQRPHELSFRFRRSTHSLPQSSKE